MVGFVSHYDLSYSFIIGLYRCTAPLDSLSCGADFVVQSAHKTLNALSQCGLLHIGYNGKQKILRKVIIKATMY